MTDPEIGLRFHKFLSAEHAVKSIETRQIKVATFDDLNDPFELRPRFMTSEPEKAGDGRLLVECWKDVIARHYGIICTSQDCDDPVVWSHYADGHKGIALKFSDGLTKVPVSIRYSDKRPTIDVSEWGPKNHGQICDRVLTTKWQTWRYEKEWRIFVPLADCEIRDGLYFWPIPPDDLDGMILGMRCGVSATYCYRSLAQNGFQNTKVFKAECCEETFKIRIRYEQPPDTSKD